MDDVCWHEEQRQDVGTYTQRLKVDRMDVVKEEEKQVLDMNERNESQGSPEICGHPRLERS